jgi:hypothetical protein
VTYSAHNFQPAGEYPILSAQQAWERLDAANAVQRSEYAVLPKEQISRSWERSFPLGQSVDLYGRVYTSPSDGTLVFNVFGASGKYPLSGNIQDLSAQSLGDKLAPIIHVWGQFEETAGKQTLNVSGWEITSLSGDFQSGRIERQGEQSRLVIDGGQVFLLPDLPADLPDGVFANVSGVVVTTTASAGTTGAETTPTFEWAYLDTLIASYGGSSSCFGGGGGGGGGPANANFGGGSFAMLKLGGSDQSSPTQPPAPYQAGDRVDGLTGQAWVTIHQYADHSENQIDMWLETPGMTFIAHLSGAGLSGIEQYHALPIRVWGRVDKVVNDEIFINVDRYEEAYPGLRVQAWLGTEAVTDVEGKQAILLTSQDGQKYILKHSIDCGDQCPIVGPPGGSTVLEGLAIPGETFGGYPVITELAASGSNGLTDLSGYAIMSDQPGVWDHTQDSPEPETLIQDAVTIESAELAYSAISLDRCTPADGKEPLTAGLFVQPMWVFKGHFDDGRRFEIRIQALPDEYLQ